MNNYVFVGKIVNSFGIKGELKIRSDFEYKDRIFKNNFNIFIGNDKLKEVISSYRIHKGYDLITLVGYTNFFFLLIEKVTLTNPSSLIFALSFKMLPKEPILRR